MADMRVNLEELKRGGVVALKGQDLFSVWVKTACCNLNSNQLRKLADITEKYGRGYLLFTTRQIPIIPFIHLNDVDRVKSELAEVDMELDRCGPRVRNLNVCYEESLCPEAVVNSISLAEKLEKFFGSRIVHKVKIGVAGCSRNCISVRTLNDIGFIGNESGGIRDYEAYAGGRLGVNPFIGLKIAEHLAEDECVRLVQNFFDLLEEQGKPGERAADLVQRLGAEEFKKMLTRELGRNEDGRAIVCPIKAGKKSGGENILKFRAVCGEVKSDQLRKIADIAEKYGYGFVHFGVRGSPEVPGVNGDNIARVREDVRESGLRLIENGLENLQSCFGNYCLESLADPQALLKKIEDKLEQFDITKGTISASGCPSSCGIAHLSDVGFHGAVEPEVDAAACSGCGLCATVCKRKAVEMVNGKAVVDMEKCRHCGLCISICPLNAMLEKRKGFTVLLGGRDEMETRLGRRVAEFVSEEEALEILVNLLKLARDYGGDLRKVIDEAGIECIRDRIVPGEKTVAEGGEHEYPSGS